MAKNDDTVIVTGIIGGAVLLLPSIIVDLTKKTSPPHRNTIPGYDGIGLTKSFLGYVDKSNLEGAIAFTDGMYLEGNQKISAEIVMIIPPAGIVVNILKS